MRGLEVHYERIRALNGVSLTVEAGEIVAIVGANGAGKTTTMRTIAGLLRPTRGQVLLEGQRIDGVAPETLVRRGICLVPEGRRIFPGLTVYENLEVATAAWRGAASRSPPIWTACTRSFPACRSASASLAGHSQAASSRCSPSAAL